MHQQPLNGTLYDSQTMRDAELQRGRWLSGFLVSAFRSVLAKERSNLANHPQYHQKAA